MAAGGDSAVVGVLVHHHWCDLVGLEVPRTAGDVIAWLAPAPLRRVRLRCGARCEMQYGRVGQSANATLIEEAEQRGRGLPVANRHPLILRGADDATHPALCPPLAYALEVEHASTRPGLVNAVA